MRRTFIIAALLVGLIVTAEASRRRLLTPGTHGSTAQTFFINQNFEGTGYDNSETWTTGAGTPDPDYTPALVGSQSLQCLDELVYKTISDESEYWTAMRIKATTLPSSDYRLHYNGPSGGGIGDFSVFLRTDGRLQVYAGAANANTITTVTTGTEYYLVIHMAKGTGNAICSVSMTTDGTIVTSGNGFAAVTTGTCTASMGRFWIGMANSGNVVFDQVRASTSQITSFP